MNAIGPKRIIMINSGKHSYANISINKATHLVGANNAGKTSLISPLQWLFIDNENSMSFPKDFQKTKKYYFKDQYSYILFECQTLDGYKVIGVRGTSRLPGDHERFIYDGEYSKKDYFNTDGSTKNGGEVKLQLSDRDYTLLKPGLLRSALTGIGLDKIAARGLNLGLLPIKNIEGYAKFRNIYHNILDLSNVGQQELKNALLHICKGSFRSKGSINLEASFNERYVHVQKQRNNLEQLKRALPHINNCVELHEKRSITRSDLKIRYEKIKQLFFEFKKDNIESKQKLSDKAEITTIKRNNTISQSKDKKKEILEITEHIGGLKSKISSYEQQKSKFTDYFQDLEVPTMEALKQTIKKLEFKLQVAELETSATLQIRIEKNERALNILQKRMENRETSVASLLREHFSDEEIGSFFALYNHQLLDLKQTDSNFIVSNSKSIILKIKIVLQNIRDGVYQDADISMPICDLKPNLSDYVDIEVLAKQIESLEQEIDKDKKTLKSAQEKEDLAAQLGNKRKDFTFRETKHTDYLRMVKEGKSIPGLKEKLNNSETQSSSLTKVEEDLKREIQELNTVLIKLRDQMEDLNNQESMLIKKIQVLPPPSSDWKIIEDAELIEDDLSLLVNNHSVFVDEEKQLSYKYDSEYILVHQFTGSSYIGGTDQETLQNLKEEVDNIDIQERALESLWGSLMTALGTNISYLLNDLDVLKEQVSKINRELSKVQISDLTAVKLRVVDNVKLTQTLSSVAKQSAGTDTYTLFSALHIDETADAMGQLQRRFQSRGKIEIADLFSLHFHVVKPDGTKEDYSELKDVESEGTTITIKVLVNLILLKGLFDGKQKIAIPFYLDEVGRLDEQNARAVVTQAEELGFTPIIASPEPMDVVSHIYGLRSGQEGLYVDDRNLMIIDRKQEVEYA